MTKKTLIAILGVLLLAGAIVVGIILVNQRQLINQKAAGLVQHLGQCTNEGCDCSTATCAGTCYIVTNYCPDQAAGSFGCQFNPTTIRGASASATFNNTCGTEQIDMGCITNAGVQTIGESWQIIPLICQNHQIQTSTPIPTATPTIPATPIITPSPTPTPTSSPLAVITPTPAITPTPTATIAVTGTPSPTSTPTQAPTSAPTNSPIAQVVSTPVPTTTPSLPVTGISTPTIFGLGSGGLLLLVSLALIL